MAALSSIEIELYAQQIVENQIIEFRRRQVSVRSPLAPQSEDAVVKQGNDVHRTKMGAERVQKLLFVRSSENLNHVELSKRFNISASSVARIIELHTASEHVCVASRAGNARGKNRFGNNGHEKSG
jgi:hypothetical protein